MVLKLSLCCNYFAGPWLSLYLYDRKLSRQTRSTIMLHSSDSYLPKLAKLSYFASRNLFQLLQIIFPRKPTWSIQSGYFCDFVVPGLCNALHTDIWLEMLSQMFVYIAKETHISEYSLKPDRTPTALCNDPVKNPYFVSVSTISSEIR